MAGDMTLLVWDKDADKGITGQAVNAKTMGYFVPDHICKERQFIRPVADVQKGLTIKAGTFIAMDVDGATQLYGTHEDKTYNYAEQLLDTGVNFQAAKDYYIYLCLENPEDATSLPTASIKISLNSTFPQGYTAEKSRKIGGFHTLCTDVGTIASHPLSGFTAGAILPASFWDLSHRPTCQPEAWCILISWISGATFTCSPEVEPIPSPYSRVRQRIRRPKASTLKTCLWLARRF